ncbi:unnamed protein product [Ranitomeya imitator]|uniref:Transducin/WD40 repeat-like superfamily protein n=1 Tax=Ranitomeya imitator TaxID=111125 RepID=A0ABN9LHR1_9NEOB|nr:unnamed protein product [Ranitomeya imitator]
MGGAAAARTRKGDRPGTWVVAPVWGLISDNLLVTGGQGCVSFWDIGTETASRPSTWESVRKRSRRGRSWSWDNAAIVCDFGSELSLVYVPSVLEKLD